MSSIWFYNSNILLFSFNICLFLNMYFFFNICFALSSSQCVDESDCSQKLRKVCNTVANINKACTGLQSQAGNDYRGRLRGEREGEVAWSRLYQMHHLIHVISFLFPEHNKVFMFLLGAAVMRHMSLPALLLRKSRRKHPPSHEFLRLRRFHFWVLLLFKI